MGTETGIEWTDHTFNPWIGCTKVSQGCTNCYAAARDARHLQEPVDHWGPGAPRKTMSANYWTLPNKWRELAIAEGRRHRVFTASMADIFDAEAPVLERRTLWKTIERTSDWLDWQIVTKRPERIKDVIEEDGLERNFFELNKCWLLTSTENQEQAQLRIPYLLNIPAAIHGISAEPLLGPLDLAKLDYREYMRRRFRAMVERAKLIHDENGIALFEGVAESIPEGDLSGEEGNPNLDVLKGTWFDGWDEGDDYPKLDWVICGGESGHRARVMQPEWARNLRDQCSAAGVAFFFKQWGDMGTGIKLTGFNADEKKGGHILDGKVWQQFPVGK